MMEQHAIPQQISSYEFKLVGEMTLSQFLKAAVGIVLALLINASGLIWFLKYPLVGILGLGGLALAFVPFQDRPLDQWLKAFIRSVYSPTIYTYKKANKNDWLEVSEEFKRKVDETETKKTDDLTIPVKQEEKVKEFIESLPQYQNQETMAKKQETKEQDVSLQMSDVRQKEEIVEEKSKVQSPKDENWHDQKASLNLKSEKLEATGKAVFGAIPMPDKPDVPNVVVGMVTDEVGKIIEGAIVEIQDEKGNPNRVLKTNSLGQFRTTTPLANGRYLVITEKDKYKFDRVNIDLTGATVDPVKIQALQI